ncbi:MAG: glutathione-disulfide reductase [Hyphomicrobiales bacterium]|nr:glutathione-disulfide reductase [Hyphomicrobiales bacterium]
MRDVDLFVIGAGSGGTRAARISAGHGARVMVAEEDRIGGTCVIRGCVPKKLYVYASRFADDMADAEAFGWSVGRPSFDWPKLRDAVAAEVTRLSGLYRKGLSGAGVEIAEERAVVAGPGLVRLVRSGEIIKARHILVATGGHPVLEPVIPGGHLGITSNEVFHLPALPRRMAVVGGGYIALEFASVFARLGVEITLIHRGDNVLRGFDQDIRTRLRDALARSGITLKLGHTITRIHDGRHGIRHVTLQDGTALDVDAVLVATGRRANTSGLGLETAGVVLNPDGSIPVDAGSQTACPGIYAVGDVTNRVNLTPVAIREGHAVADTLFGGKPWTVKHFPIATAVFTTPEIGTIGLSEHDAVTAGHAVTVFDTQFRPMRSTMTGREDRTYMKLIVDSDTDKVLGAHMLGPDSGEIIQALGVAVTMGATKADFDRTIALHPSAAEEFVTMRSPRKG